MAWLPRKRREEPAGAPSLRGEMNRLFDDFFGRAEMPALFGAGSFAPAVDVVETKESILVKAEIPGIDPKCLDITVTGDQLTIRGEKKAEKEEKGRNFHRIERSFGSFTRTVEIPSGADAGKVSAEYKDGVLCVILAKKEEAKARSIKIDVK